MMKSACKNCRFAEMVRMSENDINKTRLCKWGPPQLLMMFQQTEAGSVPVVVAQWPQVQDEMWCHRFEPIEKGPWCKI